MKKKKEITASKFDLVSNEFETELMQRVDELFGEGDKRRDDAVSIVGYAVLLFGTKLRPALDTPIKEVQPPHVVPENRGRPRRGF